MIKEIDSALKILRCRTSKEGVPLAVRWNLTYRCNLNCEYWNLHKKACEQEELPTDKIKSTLEEMSEAGVKRISFSGGEPLLREDMGKIIDYTSKKGITPTINTNGILLSERVGELENLDLAKVSLDGTEKKHNELRGKYEKTLEGIETALENGLKITLCTTFTRENYQDLKDLIELAKKYRTVIAIQRASNLSENFEEAEKLLPERGEIENALDEIIESKKHNSRVIRNSIRHLKLIKNYPEHQKFRCTAGKLFCMVMPDGTVTPCDRIPPEQDLPNLKNTNFKESFSQLERVKCYGCCFCGSMELNYLYHLKLDIVKDLFNFLDLI